MDRKLLGIFSADTPPDAIADAIRAALDEALSDSPADCAMPSETEGTVSNRAPGTPTTETPKG